MGGGGEGLTRGWRVDEGWGVLIRGVRDEEGVGGGGRREGMEGGGRLHEGEGGGGSLTMGSG